MQQMQPATKLGPKEQVVKMQPPLSLCYLLLDENDQLRGNKTQQHGGIFLGSPPYREK